MTLEQTLRDELRKRLQKRWGCQCPNCLRDRIELYHQINDKVEMQECPERGRFVPEQCCKVRPILDKRPLSMHFSESAWWKTDADLLGMREAIDAYVDFLQQHGESDE